METFNIYLAGVGGQGIGLLSELILRAADHAGHRVKAVDTHGLAQRGGIVVSQIRMGAVVFSPLIPQRQADLVVALERHEALRALVHYARPGSTLIYYNAAWQPLDVRLGTVSEVCEADIAAQCRQSGVRAFAVQAPDLADARMQNVVLLAQIDQHGLIPGIRTPHYEQAMEDLMAGRLLDRNKALYRQQRLGA